MILRRPLKVLESIPLLNYSVIEQSYSNSGDPLTKSPPIGLAQAKRDILRIFKAALKFHRANTFAKLYYNLSELPEGGGPLLKRPHIGFRHWKRGVSVILRRPVKSLELSTLLNSWVV